MFPAASTNPPKTVVPCIEEKTELTDVFLRQHLTNFSQALNDIPTKHVNFECTTYVLMQNETLQKGECNFYISVT